MSADNAYAVELKGLTFKRGERSIFATLTYAYPVARSPGSWGRPAVAKPRSFA